MKPTRLLLSLITALALTLACGISFDTGVTQAPSSNLPTNPPPPPTRVTVIPPTSYYVYEIDYSSTIKVTGGGGTGGANAWEISCPKGFLATGLIGASGIYIDSAGLQCNRLEPNGSTGKAANADPRGGTGGNKFSLPCPTSQFLVTIMGRSGIYVDQISAYCETIDLSQSFHSDPVGGEGGSAFIAKCPAGYAVTGLYGRFGNWLDSLNIICNKINKVRY
ncbi:MAG: hypothetical protein ACOYZ6_04285 [Chloroflexota bacterium]